MNQKTFAEKFLHGKEKWILYILIGVLALVISRPFKVKTEMKTETTASDKMDVGYDMFSVNPLWGNDENLLTEEQAYITYMEQRLETALSQMTGVGKTKVVVHAEPDDEKEVIITGVLVLAEGASDVSVEVKIRNSLRTLLGISERQIAVQTLEEIPVNSQIKDRGTGTKEKMQ